MELHDLDAVSLAHKIRAGDVSPVEAVRAAIARIETLDPLIGALVETRFERALDEVAELDVEAPFAGVPLLIKDAVQFSGGDLYQHGSRDLQRLQYRPPEDSE